METDVETCPGTMIWFDASDPRESHSDAILECSSCGYFLVAGFYFRPDHALCDIIREGV